MSGRQGNAAGGESANANAGAAGSTTTIQLDSMSLDELQKLQQQEEARMQALSGRFAALRQALVRIQRGSGALTDLGVGVGVGVGGGSTSSTTNSTGREVMVPLTESVYVSGTIREGSKMLVELGTGYYAEKSPKEALAFFGRKERLVERNVDNLQAAMRVTTQNLEAIRITIQGKVLEIRAKQEGVRHREAVEG